MLWTWQPLVSWHPRLFSFTRFFYVQSSFRHHQLIILIIPEISTSFYCGSHCHFLPGSKLSAFNDPEQQSRHLGLQCRTMWLSWIASQLYPTSMWGHPDKPGPPKHSCSLCLKPVKWNQKGIECEDCFEWSRSGRSSCCPNLILGGDFNCGGIDWSSNDLHSDNASSACDVALLEVAEKYCLRQHVNSTTRPASRRSLDLVISLNSNLIQAYHVVSAISDHDAFFSK